MTMKTITTKIALTLLFSIVAISAQAKANDVCTLESFGLAEGSPQRDQLQILELLGETTTTTLTRVVETLAQENSGVYDRQYKSFEVKAVAEITAESKLFPLQKSLLSMNRACVEAVGSEERAFGGSHFAVVKADNNKYLVRVSWLE